jgi:predicted GNAT family acetyltransferase
MAGIVRRLKNSAAVTGVYTPLELRGRGYAGSATAAAFERIYAEGRCFYTQATRACVASAFLAALAQVRKYGLVKRGSMAVPCSRHHLST